MSVYYSKTAERFHRFVAAGIIISLLATVIPASVFAEGEPLPEDPTPVTQEETSTSTDETTTGGTASSTVSGTDGTNASTTNDGTDGESGVDNNSTTTATSTPPQGEEGQEGTAGATPDDEVTPVEIVSDGLLGDSDGPEEVDTTGDVRRSGTNTLIETGIATAQGELMTDANSNDIRSEIETLASDYDTYTFTATGTNDARVSNDGLARSTSGDNYAQGRNSAKIRTGDAVAVFNIANVINTNVINSDGFVYLANKILEDGQSLDLTNTFFPDAAELETLSNTCSLLSCVAEDVIYNVSQMNHATITNNALIEAVTGYNETVGDRLLSSEITTGDAYAAANVMNVVNSNIIDSNYRLMTYNAIGDLDGDLVLPTGAMFDKFFSRPNGTNQVESAEDVHVNVQNINNATVDTDVDAYAETGNNDAVIDFDAVITTGRAESESNILNKINENTYGGDSMYILIRIHGYWDGEVVGLPEGLTWEWTPEGIIIYNEDAEIAPSAFLGYDQDSYSAHFENNNSVVLQNDITINAITGENRAAGLTGSIKTGNAYASANVMNIANTNIIGTNWAMAIINILGDFEGNISFAKTDITLGGSVSALSPLAPGGTLTYTYVVSNHSNSTATNIVLDQVLENARTSGGQTTQSVTVGTLAPGASKQVTLSAIVNSNIPYGTTTVNAYASVSGDQGDINNADNLLMLSKIATRVAPNVPGQGSGTTTNPGGGTGTTTNPGGNTGTTTNPGGGNGTPTPPAYSQANYYAQGTYNTGSGGGGGGGGSSASKKKKVEREVKDVDPNKAPLLTIKKIAIGIDEGEIVTAGQSVDYKITVSNAGGNAYDAQVFDVLTNPIGSVMNEQSWDLGTILPGEEIVLTYTTEYNPSTPSGKYTNTASVVAYLKDGMKELKQESLKAKNAENTIEIKGLDLAVGNVAVLAYFPGANGLVSALVTWETSKPSLSQIFYGLTQTLSPYNPIAVNFGYQSASFKFPTAKPKHMMIITGLQPGRTHSYRIHAQSDKYLATSREYSFTVPAAVQTLTLAVPTSGAPMVAGAAATAPAYVAPKPAYVPPKPAPAPVVAAPAPLPQPAATGVGGFVNKVKNKLFNFLP